MVLVWTLAKNFGLIQYSAGNESWNSVVRWCFEHPRFLVIQRLSFRRMLGCCCRFLMLAIESFEECVWTQNWIGADVSFDNGVQGCAWATYQVSIIWLCTSEVCQCLLLATRMWGWSHHLQGNRCIRDCDRIPPRPRHLESRENRCLEAHCARGTWQGRHLLLPTTALWPLLSHL